MDLGQEQMHNPLLTTQFLDEYKKLETLSGVEVRNGECGGEWRRR